MSVKIVHLSFFNNREVRYDYKLNLHGIRNCSIRIYDVIFWYIKKVVF